MEIWTCIFICLSSPQFLKEREKKTTTETTTFIEINFYLFLLDSNSSCLFPKLHLVGVSFQMTTYENRITFYPIN